MSPSSTDADEVALDAAEQLVFEALTCSCSSCDPNCGLPTAQTVCLMCRVFGAHRRRVVTVNVRAGLL